MCGPYLNLQTEPSTGDGSRSRPSERRKGSGSVACFNQSESAAIGRATPYIQKNPRCVIFGKRILIYSALAMRATIIAR